MKMKIITELSELLDNITGCMSDIKNRRDGRELIQLIDTAVRVLILELMCFWDYNRLKFECKMMIVESYSKNVETYEQFTKDLVYLSLLLEPGKEEVIIEEIKQVGNYFWVRGLVNLQSDKIDNHFVA